MRLTALILMLLMGLTFSPAVEANSMVEVELRDLYGLPFNRPPYYRRGPRPPAVRAHERYYRPGRQKIREPFDRDEYLLPPQRHKTSEALSIEWLDADEQEFWDKFRDSVMKDKPEPAPPPKVVERKPVDPPKEAEKPKVVERRKVAMTEPPIAYCSVEINSIKVNSIELATSKVPEVKAPKIPEAKGPRQVPTSPSPPYPPVQPPYQPPTPPYPR